MKLKALCIKFGLALAIPFVITVQAAHAEADLPIQQMAQIVLHMGKVPDKQQLKTLKELADNAPSTNEQRLAKGLMSFDGGLSSDGKQQVWAVLRQISASDGERELAKIINKFDGNLTPGEKARLNALLPAPPKAEQKGEKSAQKAEKKADKKNQKSAKKEGKK